MRPWFTLCCADWLAIPLWRCRLYMTITFKTPSEFLARLGTM